MDKKHIKAVNVDNCGLKSLCERTPCLNGGTCLNINETLFECFCDDKYFGKFELINIYKIIK